MKSVIFINSQPQRKAAILCRKGGVIQPNSTTNGIFRFSYNRACHRDSHSAVYRANESKQGEASRSRSHQASGIARKPIAQPTTANGFARATGGACDGPGAKGGSRPTSDPGGDTCSRSIQGNTRAAANPKRAPRPEGAATRQTNQTADQLGAIHGREIVRM